MVKIVSSRCFPKCEKWIAIGWMAWEWKSSKEPVELTLKHGNPRTPIAVKGARVGSDG